MARSLTGDCVASGYPCLLEQRRRPPVLLLLALPNCGEFANEKCVSSLISVRVLLCLSCGVVASN